MWAGGVWRILAEKGNRRGAEKQRKRRVTPGIPEKSLVEGAEGGGKRGASTGAARETGRNVSVPRGLSSIPRGGEKGAVRSEERMTGLGENDGRDRR